MWHLVVEADSLSGFPSSADLLWNLETLVISHYGEVINSGMWFQIRRSASPYVVIFMENLQTLKGVHNLRFTKEVIKRTPKIKKLGMEFDGDVKSWSHDYYCFINLELLHKLESFHCFSQSESYEELQNLAFPHSLKKLSLRSYYIFGKDILEKIGTLPLLEKLVLRDGCFSQFSSLKILSLEVCDDLERWMTESSHFLYLEHLRFSGLKELDEVPAEIGYIATLRSIELVYSSKFAVECMRKIVKEQEQLQGIQLSFRVPVSKLKWGAFDLI